jgi:DNA-binding transcriptional LysR family regulator
MYARAPTPKLLGLERELANVIAIVNDIGAVREACVAGAGWCVVPRYTVAREIESGALRVVPGANITPDRFATFWLRARTDGLPWLDALFAWVAARRL